MSEILEFYKGEKPNQEGLYWNDIMKFSDDELEHNHTYIQWLFPLKEPSLAVSGSPVLKDDDIEFFSKDWKDMEELKVKWKLRNDFLLSFNKMIEFYGFKRLVIDSPYDGKSLTIGKDPNTFEQKASNWLQPKNHNFLRISRILGSLIALGYESTAKMFHDCLCGIYEEYKGTIGPLTKQFWDDTMETEG